MPHANDTTAKPGKKKTILVGLAIVAALISTAHWSVLSAEALSLDDTEFLTHNPLVQNPSWSSAQTFLTEVLEPSTVRGYYLPLSMISLMGDYAMGGRPDDLTPFHRTSLILHVLNCLLLIVLMGRLFGWGLPVFAAGLIFGLHPLVVEPLIWVGERKTLLAAFFALCSLLAHERHARNGGWRWMVAAALAYAMAMMSKPTAVMIPLLLIVMDYWPLNRLNKRALLEKAPILGIAAVFSIIALLSHGKTAGFLSTEAAPASARIPLVLYLCAFYPGKMLWPTNLSPIYATPGALSLTNPIVLSGMAMLASVLVLAIIALKRTRAVAGGVLFFGIAIAPTLGLVRYSWVTASDKYVYLPAFGLAFLTAWGLSQLWNKANARNRIVIICALVLVFALETIGSHRAASHWRDTESHFRYLVQHAPGHPMAHYGLGQSLHRQEQYVEAAKQYGRVLEVVPNYAEAWHDLGVCLFEQGQITQAITHYRHAIELKPELAELHRSLGIALEASGEVTKAIESFHKAIALDPTNALAHSDLAKTLYKKGDAQEALIEFRQAVQLDPAFVIARNGLGVVLADTGKIDESIEEFRSCLKIEPNNAEVHNSLANSFLRKREFSNAIDHYTRAVILQPEYAIAHHNLAVLLAKMGRTDEAIRHHQLAIKADPKHIKARINLANLLASLTRYEEAVDQLREAIKLKPDAPAPYNNLATILSWQGKLSEAVNVYQNVAHLLPNDADIQCTLGKMYLRLKDTPAAVSCFKKALAVDPQHKEANAQLRKAHPTSE